MFCARVDVDTAEINNVNAGHDRAVLLRADKKRTITLNTTGTVLGLSAKTVFERRTSDWSWETRWWRLQTGSPRLLTLGGVHSSGRYWMACASTLMDQPVIWPNTLFKLRNDTAEMPRRLRTTKPLLSCDA